MDPRRVSRMGSRRRRAVWLSRSLSGDRAGGSGVGRADANGSVHPISMKITIPELSLVVLVGPSGAGKSTFVRKHFKLTEVLSSDYCRGLVSDDENSQAATKDAFEVLQFIAAKRLAVGQAHRHRRDQCSGRGAKAADRTGPRVSLHPDGYRVRPTGAAVRRTECDTTGP